MELGELNRNKLYASAWTAALLRQAAVQAEPEQVQSLEPWLDQLVKSGFVLDDGLPQLQNLYFYHLLRTSLGQGVDRSAVLNTLQSLQDSSGLFRWAPEAPPDLTATQVAVELLAALNAEEIASPTRGRLQGLLETESWVTPLAPAVFLNEKAPLLIAGHQLGLQLPPAAKEAIINWNSEYPAQGVDPLSVEVLLQLAELNRRIGGRLELPLSVREDIRRARGSEGGYGHSSAVGLEPQLTYKIQKLMQMVYNEPPAKDAARWAKRLFFGDSWYAGRPVRVDARDTYYGLVIAELLGEPVPDREQVIRFLEQRVQDFIETDPGTAVQSRAVEELDYAIRAMALLDMTDWPEGTRDWVGEALAWGIDQDTPGDSRVLHHLTGAASQLGMELDLGTKARLVEVLMAQAPIAGAEVEQAYYLTEIARSAALDVDELRTAPVVQAAFRRLADSHQEQVSETTLFSWFRNVQVLCVLDPEEARSVLPVVRHLVTSRMNFDGGIAPTDHLRPSLRSTAEGLMLLSWR